VDGIQRAFHVVFGPHEFSDRRVAALEDGRELEPLVRYQTQVHGYPGSIGGEVWVSSIVFRSATRADVAFDFIRSAVLNERGGGWGWEILGGARFEEDRWKVTRETFCLSFGGNLAEADCPRQGPMPTTTTLPAPRLQVAEGFPAEPGHLLVRDGNGDVWVLDAKGSTRLSDVGLPAHDPYLSSGYDAARFGPRGEVYAQRTEGHDLIVERLIRPGQTEIVLRLPAHDDETETSGYVSSLSVGRHGLVLLYHEEAGEEEHWRAELRPWTDLAATGRRSEPSPADRSTARSIRPSRTRAPMADTSPSASIPTSRSTCGCSSPSLISRFTSAARVWMIAASDRSPSRTTGRRSSSWPTAWE
jgi:hypothetical protein